MTTLGRQRGHCVVIKPERTTWNYREMLGDHLRVSLVKFGGEMKH
jgi:hypothetical protein